MGSGCANFFPETFFPNFQHCDFSGGRKLAHQIRKPKSKTLSKGALRVKALYRRLKYIFLFCIFKNPIEVFIFDATIDSVKQGKDQTHEDEERRITTE